MKYIKVDKELFERDNINYRKFSVGYGHGDYTVRCYFTWKKIFPSINKVGEKNIKLEKVIKFEVYSDYTPDEKEYYLHKKEFKKRIKERNRMWK